MLQNTVTLNYYCVLKLEHHHYNNPLNKYSIDLLTYCTGLRTQHESNYYPESA